MSRNLATALAVSAALALGACGDDGEETTAGETGGQTTALTKDAYIEQASELCARTNSELEQIHGALQQDVALIEQEMADLRALPAPEGEEARVDAMLSAGEHALVIERQAAEAGHKVQQEDPYTEFERLAQHLGIEGGCTEAGR
jgi:hypothetical protein